MTLETTEPQVRRDRFLRPYIKQADGKEITYTRTTTFVGAFEDMYKISLWSQRHTARGVALHDDLITAIRAAHPDNRQVHDTLVAEAKERSGAGDAARFGTYMHKVTEAADKGEDPRLVPLPLQSYGYVPADAHVPDLAAYVAATAELEPVHIERMTVYDDWKVAGTPDRVVRYQGQLYIADLKTGTSVDLGAGKIAAQLAMYARGLIYDIVTGERTPHNASLDRGIVIHAPQGTGTCEVKWIDLRSGWEIAKVCKEVRGVRSLNANQLYTAIGPGKNDRTLHQILANASGTSAPQPVSTPRLSWGADEIGAAILDATTPAELNALWARHKEAWTPDLTQLGRERIAELEAAASQ